MKEINKFDSRSTSESLYIVIIIIFIAWYKFECDQMVKLNFIKVQVDWNIKNRVLNVTKSF